MSLSVLLLVHQQSFQQTANIFSSPKGIYADMIRRGSRDPKKGAQFIVGEIQKSLVGCWVLSDNFLQFNSVDVLS